jgi:histidinol-phosphate aminotransferase
LSRRIHGGPDAQGLAAFDFSTNANACGPCPQALAAVKASDPAHYPDPAYTDLRAALANLHGVAPRRIVLATSASEFIFRITFATAGPVWLPQHAYGDYAQAAAAHGRVITLNAIEAGLAWLCDPSSPQGRAQEDIGELAAVRGTVVLDRAYEPLRLSGRCVLQPAQLNSVWQLYTPNKALGLTGVRAAYAIAPENDAGMATRMESLSPSWPLGAHGVALLSAWCQAEARQWVAQSLQTLRTWKGAQAALCESMGWRVTPGEANFFCAQAPGPDCLAGLRSRGIKLRDTTSFGLPGQVRMSVQPPASQQALRAAWHEFSGVAA